MAMTHKTLDELEEDLIRQADGGTPLSRQDCYDLLEAIRLLDRIRACTLGQTDNVLGRVGLWRTGS